MILYQPEETNDNILSIHFRKKPSLKSEKERQEFDFKNLLYNDVTSLPTLPVMFDYIQNILNKQGRMGFLYINIIQYSMLEQIYGWRKFDFFTKELASTLVYIRNSFMREHDAVCELMIKGSTFMLLLSPSRTKRIMTRTDLKNICERIGRQFSEALRERLDNDVFEKLGCYFGYSILEDDTTQRLERLVYNVIEEAHQSSINQKKEDAKLRSATLQNIVRNKKISTLYQPILDFGKKNIIGYEALNRGPVGEFENPDYLFRLAYQNDAVWALDRLCRTQAFRGLNGLSQNHMLFLNVEPQTFDDPNFFARETLSLMKKAGIKPEQVVLEITERQAIENIDGFKKVLASFKKSGFKTAIDDLGTGYSGLQTLSELLPGYIDFIKLDMSLTRNISKHNFKQEIISFMLRLTKDIPTSVIVEGIESPDELKTIRRLGVQYAQGFLFAPPTKNFQEIDWASLE